MTGVHLRAPAPQELSDLTGLCLRAKAVSGYDKAFMDACVPAFSFTDVPSKDWLRVAVSENRILGVAQLSTAPPLAHLEKLFIEPDAMGQGVGRLLFQAAVNEALNRGDCTAIRIVSDPGAVPFYQRMGADLTGEREPSEVIEGRSLPVLSLRLDPPHPQR